MSPVINDLPKLVAFDLDGTLWWPEMYMLSGKPFTKCSKSGAVMDRAKEEVKLMGASQSILADLGKKPEWKGSEVAYVSRTDYPEWAEECLRLITVHSDGTTMDDVGQHTQIYPGTKTTHFKRIHQDSGIDYKDMIFFDNESRNCRDVRSLGVTCVYAPDGMTETIWKQGLSEFKTAKGSSA